MNYDWDSLNVGNPWLNTSQNFFRFPHALHERNAIRSNTVVTNGVKPIKQTKQYIQQHQKLGQGKQPGNSKYRSEKTKGNANEATSESGGDQHNKENTLLARNRLIPVAISRIHNKNVANTAEIDLTKKFQKSLKLPDALNKQNESKKTNDIEPQFQYQLRKFVSSDVQNCGSRLFEYAEISRKKKEQLALKFKRSQDEQLKFSSFHAQPAPKFISSKSKSLAKLSVGDGKKFDRKLVKQMSLPQVSVMQNPKDSFVPNCGDPERIKFMAQKKKSLIDKYVISQQLQTNNFKANPADVLKKQPFQLTYNPTKKAEIKPFKLHLMDRLSQRQEFNKKNMEAVNKKKVDEEMKKRQQDSQSLKLIRQKTEFKARPNPFRNAN